MEHHTSSHFWKQFNALPPEIQTLALENYDLLKANPRHPSLQFKKAGKVWSARVGRRHRAVAVQNETGFLWVWIGTHAEYEKFIKAEK
jgi:hypothetical protein